MLSKIQKDLERMFQEHGMEVIFNKSIAIEKNSLNEVVRKQPIPTTEVVIPSNQQQNFVGSLIGEIRSGGISLLLRANTALKEKDVIALNSINYSMSEIEPVYAFGELICFKGQAERVDGHGRFI